jgi:hypothetical protein
MNNNSSAVSILLKEINELKDRVRELENYVWIHNAVSNTAETITAETVEWYTIPLVNYDRRSYITTGYNNYIDYSNIVNMPNMVTNISAQPDALIVDYSNWQRSFVPLCITSRNGWYNI